MLGLSRGEAIPLGDAVSLAAVAVAFAGLGGLLVALAGVAAAMRPPTPELVTSGTLIGDSGGLDDGTGIADIFNAGDEPAHDVEVVIVHRFVRMDAGQDLVHFTNPRWEVERQSRHPNAFIAEIRVPGPRYGREMTRLKLAGDLPRRTRINIGAFSALEAVFYQCTNGQPALDLLDSWTRFPDTGLPPDVILQE